MIKIMCAAFILLSALFSACSNASSIADAVWVQKATVPLVAKEFRSCVINAISTVPNVAANIQDTSVPMLIPLTTTLNLSIANLSVNVRHTGNNEVEISFIGKGTTESEEQKNLISPLLDRLIKALAKACGS